MKKKFICTVCGYIYEGTEAPEKCPICKAPASKFKEMEDAVDDDMTFATVHVLGQAYKDGVNEDVIKGLKDHFNGECGEVGMYLAMARQADREGYPEIAEAYKRYAYEEADHASRFAELLGEVLAAAILLVVSANAKRARLQAESEAAASAAQAAAESEAAAKAASEAAEAAARAEEEAKQKRANQVAAASEAHENTRYGDKLGRIWVEGTNVDCDLYLGDSETQFSRGAGCHAEDGCVLPGENGTVFIGAHTGTYFSDLGSCEIGAIIHLETTWGDFAYKITDMQVILETDIDKVRWGAEEPSCILYTCYPFGILTHTPQRYAVYADPVSADEYGVVPAETTEK